METDKEDTLLQSVALQNAQAIRLARRRAEEELVRAKEELEQKTLELSRSLAMVRATLESTTDAILATDQTGAVTGFNERFLKMWGFSTSSPELSDHRQIVKESSQQLRDPDDFLGRIDEIYASSTVESHDVLELGDGRVIERFSRLQVLEGENVGRVWSFRDITERMEAEKQLSRLAAIVE